MSGYFRCSFVIFSSSLMVPFSLKILVVPAGQVAGWCLGRVSELPKCDAEERSCEFAQQMRRGVQPLAGALARHTQGYEIQHAAIKCTVLILVYKRVAHLLRSLHHYAGKAT